MTQTTKIAIVIALVSAVIGCGSKDEIAADTAPKVNKAAAPPASGGAAANGAGANGAAAGAPTPPISDASKEGLEKVDPGTVQRG